MRQGLAAKTRRTRREHLRVLRAFAALSLLGTAAGAIAQPVDPPASTMDAPTVTASVSAPTVVLGDEFYLFVRATYLPGMQVNLPASLPLGSAFEERARTDSTQANPDGTITRDFEVALQAFEVGELVIPPIPVTWAAQGRAMEVTTDPVAVQVSGLIGDGEATLRDIAGPVEVERPDWTLVWIGVAVGGALLLLLVVLLARRVWRRRRRRALARLPEALQRSAHEEALARLDDVEASGALDAEDRKPAYLAMSEILRGYIGRRYGFPALDLTTDEIRRALDARAGGAVASELITGWLEKSDMVKYARGDASPDEARQALYDARIFIDRTRPSVGVSPPTAPPQAPS
jgi:hypothetical protein